MKKKWVAVVVILICCLVYAIVKLSMSENQNVNSTTEEKQSTKQINAGDTDVATPSEETRSAKQINAENTDKAKPEEGSDSAIPADQVEAITKVFGEFQSAIRSEDYEQAWKLTSEFFKQRVSDGSFEKFRENMTGEGAGIATATIHPESATVIEGRVGLLVTSPSFEYDLYLCFVEDNEKWKLDIGRPAHSVNASKQ